MNNSMKQLQRGWETAFVDKSIYSDERYRPRFVLNDSKQGRKVLTAIEGELGSCDSFCFSVAFVTMTGITPLLQTLKELEENNIPGRIITTDYLGFSEPKALKVLNSFSNIELRFYCAEERGFHTKGYIFKQGQEHRIILGSANLTGDALTKNEEWNTRLVSMEQGEYVDNIVTRFEQLWQDEHTKSYAEIAAAYETYYESKRQLRQENDFVTIQESTGSYITKLQPNLMQQQFVENLISLRDHGAKRALLISATGTGKTYAAAFGVRTFQPKRMLFLIHREQIAKQAMKSFVRVLGARSASEMGLLSGTTKDSWDKKYIFATIQTVSKTESLMHYARNAFDFIIVDEAHHGGACSYQKIIDYFSPKMLLGMTASPDRTDGFDIYGLFDHNIAYEIRLQQALEEDFLCPFHYFGITDAYLDDEALEKDNLDKAITALTDDARVDFVLEKIQYYGYSGSRVKGVIFCSRNKEADLLSQLINQRINPDTNRCYRTISIAGKNTSQEREQAIERLVNDSLPEEEKLDYIISVDIFNEGVDIPEINQVIMLRPTQSPVVFIQQLGRGLRKYQNKEYVVILDFIGNYVDKNFMIPIALSGDRSYNKDNIRRCLIEGNRVIPGESTIHFDKIAKQRIFQSIDNSNLGDIRLIRENYEKLRNKLGRIPRLMEFDAYGEMDVSCIFRHGRLGSYYKFLSRYEKEYQVKLNGLEEKMLNYISSKFGEGKRPHELVLLKLMLAGKERLLRELQQVLRQEYGIEFRRNTRKNIVNLMTGSFATGSAKNTFADCIFIETEGEDYKISDVFAKCLENKDFRNMVQEVTDFGLYRYAINYQSTYGDKAFRLYQKYDYEDVCRLLEWSQNVVPLNIGGYKYDQESYTYPVFINYDKAEGISESIAYHDRFENNGQLIAISKGKRTTESEDVRRFMNAARENLPVDLFVRKNKNDKNEAKNFYYLGRMYAQGCKNITMKSGESAAEIFWNLEVPVREDIYDYITSEVM